MTAVPLGGFQQPSDVHLPLLHGGLPGLAPGDRLTTGAENGYGGRCPGVWVTNDFLTAALFAHVAGARPIGGKPNLQPRWGIGSVYLVEPTGTPVAGATVPGEVAAKESWELPGAVVLSVVAERVNLPAALYEAIRATQHPQHMYRPVLELMREGTMPSLAGLANAAADEEGGVRTVEPEHVRLYHGGAPGLRVGDWIEPGRERGEGRLYDVAPYEDDRVYVTTDRDYAEKFAHQYPYGDVYRVRPVGPLARSWADGPESYTCERAKVVGLHRRAVALSAAQLRRIDTRLERAYMENGPEMLAWLAGGVS